MTDSSATTEPTKSADSAAGEAIRLLREWRVLDVGVWAVERHAMEKADLIKRTNAFLEKQ